MNFWWSHKLINANNNKANLIIMHGASFIGTNILFAVLENVFVQMDKGVL